jgi:F-type H+-transporting ATPase subunit delta
LIGSRVSKRYAKALLSLGQEDGRFEQYGDELTEFTGLLEKNIELGRVIANPVFALEDRKKVLRIILDRGNLSEVVRNFLNLLLDKNRMGAIGAIRAHYSRLVDEASGIARAEIITARPLQGEVITRLERSLEQLTSKKVKSEIREDKALIGGVVVRIGDLVLDGSVRAQLEGLKQTF